MTARSDSRPATRSDRVAARPALNVPLIWHRAQALGVSPAHLDSMLGVSLRTLAQDPDHRAVGLTVLVRLGRVLDLPIDDLVLTDDPHVQPPPQPEHQSEPVHGGDGHLLLGLLASYNGLPVDRILRLLGWNRQRLDHALADIGARLTPTALRVAATDERLTLTLRPGVLPASVRARFAHDQTTDLPLEPTVAVELLDLVRAKILEPFPENQLLCQSHIDSRPHDGIHNAAHLINRRLAVPAPDTVGDPDRPPTTELQAHPDVMFALGLVESSSLAPPPPNPPSPPDAR